MFRLHMKPVVTKKAAAKQRADKAKVPAAASTSSTPAPAEQKPSDPPAEEPVAAPSVPEVPAEPVENVTAPIVEPGRTRTVSVMSQDESASSADEARKPKVASRFIKSRLKPFVPKAKTTPAKVVAPVEPPVPEVKVVPPPAPAVTPAEVTEAVEARPSEQTPEASKSGPSAHLVPAAPNCVPSNEHSSSEDEGVIDPYNPDHPLGHRENPDKCRGTKSPWVLRKYRTGEPIAMIDYLIFNPKTNPMVHDDDEDNFSTAAKTEKLEEEVDDPDEDDRQIAAPQLKLGPDGNFILDDKSLVIESSTAREGRKALQSKSPAGNKRSNRHSWSVPETLFFYKCLNSIGTDFGLMARFFPHRNRHQLKLKYKLEEKRNPKCVGDALEKNVKYEVSDLELEYRDVSEAAVQQRLLKQKPKQPKPPKPRAPRPSRSRRNRKDYVFETGSGSDEDSSSDDENDARLRAELATSMADTKEKSVGVARSAFVEVVPNTGSVAPKPLNPNALTIGQVSQLTGQRVDKDKLLYGKSELASLLNSPTIREKENERKQRLVSAKGVGPARRIVLEQEANEEPEAGQQQLANEGQAAEQQEPAEANSGDEMECIAQSFSKPTKSGRVPKLRLLNSAAEEDEAKPKRARIAPKNIAKKPKSRPKHKEVAADPVEPAESEEDANECEDSTEVTILVNDIPNAIGNAKPGSIVLIKTALPNEPDKEVFQVFMVPPENHSGTTVEHNPDGSVNKVTMGGTELPLLPGTMISPAALVPIVAASSGSTVVQGQNLPEQDPPTQD